MLQERYQSINLMVKAMLTIIINTLSEAEETSGRSTCPSEDNSSSNISYSNNSRASEMPHIIIIKKPITNYMTLTMLLALIMVTPKRTSNTALIATTERSRLLVTMWKNREFNLQIC